jgi:tRNA (guanine37-N1)-methyltransferase
MRVDIITLFPEMFAPLEHSIVKRAREAGHLDLTLHQLRDYAYNKHRQVDDVPYGGGAGMVLKPEPFFEAIRAIAALAEGEPWVISLTPQGEPLRQPLVEQLATRPRLLLLCGHYEGMDERVTERFVHQEISLGDFVMTGGEIAAMALVDAVTRLLPGVIDAESLLSESFHGNLLEAPHYTRPQTIEDMSVPEVLLSGHHANIDKWRREEALRRTLRKRPDLLASADLSEREREWLLSAGNQAELHSAMTAVFFVYEAFWTGLRTDERGPTWVLRGRAGSDLQKGDRFLWGGRSLQVEAISTYQREVELLVGGMTGDLTVRWHDGEAAWFLQPGVSQPDDHH